jgi:hypothetical protein
VPLLISNDNMILTMQDLVVKLILSWRRRTFG